MPSREQFPTASSGRDRGADKGAARGHHTVEQAAIPAGAFAKGEPSADRTRAGGEVSRHEAAISAFEVDATTVTNDDFARFVEAKGYAAEAESFGFSAVFHLAIDASAVDVMRSAAGTLWWAGVKGADWRRPGRRRSDIDGRGDHPVVHISWNDAQAYCTWAGWRLPIEAEWVYAARGGLEGAKYSWGDGEVDEDGWRADIFQGAYPRTNTLEDGFRTTAPVCTFEPNGYGLWQMAGNVWAWCQDWFHPGTCRRGANAQDRALVTDPVGHEEGLARTAHGGSYVRHHSYCNRYRNSARFQNTPGFSMGNGGFRTVARREGTA